MSFEQEQNKRNPPSGTNANTSSTTKEASADAGDCMNASSATVLTCETVLSPPLQQLGGGSANENDDRLVYSNKQPAWQCTFSRDGVYLAVCYGAPDPCIRIWKQQQLQLHDIATTEAAGATSGNKYPKQQQTNNKQNTSSFNYDCDWNLHATLDGIHTRTIRSVAFAPINRPLILASASFDGTVAIWEQQQQSPDDNNKNNTDQQPTNDYWDCTAQLEGHDNEVKSVTWNATGSLLATCGRDKTVWIWECFLPGTVGGGPGNDEDGGGDFECIAVLHGHEGDVKCVQFAASHNQWGDGDEIVLSASYDETIRVWAEDAGDWYCAACLKSVHTSTIWTLTVAPSGTRLISGSADGSLAIYKCYSADELKQQQQQLAADNEDNNSSSSGKQNSNRAVWKCVGKLPNAHHSMTVYSAHCAPARVGHGRIASGGADNCVHIYREVVGATTDQQPVFQLDASSATADGGGDVNCVCWHPWEGSMLASAGDDGKVRIWNYQV